MISMSTELVVIFVSRYEQVCLAAMHVGMMAWSAFCVEKLVEKFPDSKVLRHKLRSSWSVCQYFHRFIVVLLIIPRRRFLDQYVRRLCFSFFRSIWRPAAAVTVIADESVHHSELYCVKFYVQRCVYSSDVHHVVVTCIKFPLKITQRVRRIYGLYREAVGEWDEAITIYEEILKEAPEQTFARKRMIAIRRTQGKLPEAMDLATKYLKTFETDKEVGGTEMLHCFLVPCRVSCPPQVWQELYGVMYKFFDMSSPGLAGAGDDASGDWPVVPGDVLFRGHHNAGPAEYVGYFLQDFHDSMFSCTAPRHLHNSLAP